MTEKSMRQDAPYPTTLLNLVRNLQYKPGWDFYLVDTERGQGSVGLTLLIIPTTTNSYDHEDTHYRVQHLFIVPAAAYNEQSWRRWLFERILDVEKHEAMEFFVINDERPLAPCHGPGYDPYQIFEYTDEVHRRTDFRGIVHDE